MEQLVYICGLLISGLLAFRMGKIIGAEQQANIDARVTVKAMELLSPDSTNLKKLQAMVQAAEIVYGGDKNR